MKPRFFQSAAKDANGKTVAEIRPKAGASRQEVIELPRSIKITKEETKELKAALDAVSEVIGYAGGCS